MKGGRKRGRETSMCGCISCVPNRGPGLQPSHVPWLGLKPVNFWFAGRRSIHWATPARVVSCHFLTFIFPFPSVSLIFSGAAYRSSLANWFHPINVHETPRLWQVTCTWPSKVRTEEYYPAFTSAFQHILSPTWIFQTTLKKRGSCYCD